MWGLLLAFLPVAVSEAGDKAGDDPTPPSSELSRSPWQGVVSQERVAFCARRASELSSLTDPNGDPWLSRDGEVFVNFDRFDFDQNSGARRREILESLEKCPRSPELLILASREESRRRLELPPVLDSAIKLDPLRQQLKTSRHQILEWILMAENELKLRGTSLSPAAMFLRARAHLELGEFPEAAQIFASLLGRSGLSPWKVHCHLALAELYGSHFESALKSAFRCQRDAPVARRSIAEYLAALVFDRSGDYLESQRILRRVLRKHGHVISAKAVMAMMPVHERLYFHALVQQSRENTAGALRLWNAYLAQPEVDEPEKQSARRHLGLIAGSGRGG